MIVSQVEEEEKVEPPPFENNNTLRGFKPQVLFTSSLSSVGRSGE